MKCNIQLVLFSLFVTGLHCTPDFDTDRQIQETPTCLVGEPTQRGRCSFGEEVYNLIIEHVIQNHQAPELALPAIENQAIPFIIAVNTVFPDNQSEHQQAFFHSLAPNFHYHLPQLSAAFSETLADLTTQHEFITAINHVIYRRNYQPQQSNDFFHYILSYPHLDSFLKASIDHTLQRCHYIADSDTDGHFISVDPILVAFSEILLTSHPNAALDYLHQSWESFWFQTDEHIEDQPWYIVKTDSNGLPLVNDSNGIPGPFRDDDGNTHADINSYYQYINDVGEPFYLPPFTTDYTEDMWGRPIDNGQLIYDYHNLGQSMLLATLKEVQQLYQAPPLFNGSSFGLLSSIPHMFDQFAGPKRQPDTNGVPYYYLSSNHPFRNYIQAITSMLNTPASVDVFSGIATLFANESLFAKTMHSWQSNVPDEDPHTALSEGNQLVEDLTPVLYEISQTPGLIEDILLALAHAPLDQLSSALHMMMSYKRNPYSGDDTYHYMVTEEEFWLCQSDVENCPWFVTAVDHEQADTHFNESYMQRFLKLFYDMSQITYMPVSNNNDTSIPDLAAYYIDVISNTCRSENVLSNDIVATINNTQNLLDPDSYTDHPETRMSNCPTRQAWHHFLNFDHHGIDSVVDAFGLDYKKETNISLKEHYLLRNHHGDTVFVAEISGLLDAMAILLKPFSDHQCNYYDDDAQTEISRSCSYLAGNLLAILGKHYPTPEHDQSQSTNLSGVLYSDQSNIRSFEPLLSASMVSQQLLPQLQTTLTQSEQLSSQQHINLYNAIERFLLHISSGDIPPVLQMKQAMKNMDSFFVEHDQLELQLQHWKTYLYDHFITTQPDAQSFVNEHTAPIVHYASQAIIQFLRQKQTQGHYEHFWLVEVEKGLSEYINSNDIALLMMLHEHISTNQELSYQAQLLADYLFGPQADLFPMLQTLAITIQNEKDRHTLDGLHNAFGTFISQNYFYNIDLILIILDTMIASNTSQYFYTMVAQSFLASPNNAIPLQIVWDFYAQLHRNNSSFTTPLSPGDTRSILQKIASDLQDEQYGLEKFYQIMQGALQ